MRNDGCQHTITNLPFPPNLDSDTTLDIKVGTLHAPHPSPLLRVHLGMEYILVVVVDVDGTPASS